MQNPLLSNTSKEKSTLYNPRTPSNLSVFLRHSHGPENAGLVCKRVFMVSKGWPTRHFVVPEAVPARNLPSAFHLSFKKIGKIRKSRMTSFLFLSYHWRCYCFCCGHGGGCGDISRQSLQTIDAN